MPTTEVSRAEKGSVAAPVAGTQRLLVVPATLLLLVLAALYIPGLKGPWVFDDFVNVVDAAPNDDSLGALARATFSNGSGLAGRSVSALTFALNHRFGNGDVGSFKLTNLIMHAGVCIAAIALGYSLARRLSPNRSRAEAACLALAASAVWALHPIQVSTVLYVVQRMSILAMLFSSLALLSWIAARSATRRRTASVLYASCLCALALATLSKETGLLAAGYILVFELVNPNGLARRSSIQWIAIGASVAVAVGTLVLIVTLSPEPLMGGYALRDFTWKERLLTQVDVMAEYLRQLAFADTERMRFYYDDWSTATSFGPSTLLGAAMLIGLASLAVITRRIAPLVSFGIGVFFTSHLIESTVLPLEHAFEHRNYVGSFGLALALVALLTRLAHAGRTVTLVVVLTLSLVPAYLAAQTASRVSEWSDNLTLHREAVRRAPDSFRAVSALSQIYFWSEGDGDRALATVREALAVAPNDLSRQLLASIYGALTGTEASFVNEALRDAASMDSIRRETTHLLYHIVLLSAEGRPGMPSMSEMTDLQRLIVDNPNQLITPLERANLLMDHSDFLIRLDRRREALDRAMEAVVLAPSDPDALLRLAKRQAAVENYEAARKAIVRARGAVDWRSPALAKEIDTTGVRIETARNRASSLSSIEDGAP